MDFSLIIGIVLGFGALLFGFAHEGGSLESLQAISSFIIVFGGTIGAVIASFPLHDVLQAIRGVIASFKVPHSGTTEQIINKISTISSAYRKDGVVALDAAVQDSDLNKE